MCETAGRSRMATWQPRSRKGGELGSHNSPTISLVAAAVFAVIFVSWVPCRADDLNSDAAALRAFYDGLDLAQRVEWNVSESPCDWKGVVCSPTRDRVWYLKLPASGLYGQIRPGSLGRLSDLRILSLRSNYLSGPFPADLANCTQLRSLFLQHNALTGPLPAFQPSSLLTRIDLSFNKFNGSIPASLNNLPNLRVLLLQNNSLSGNVPDLSLPHLREFSVENNELTGNFPRNTQNLCGAPPLSPCPRNSATSASPPILPYPPTQKEPKSLTTGDTLAIAVAALALLFLIAICMLISRQRTRKTEPNEKPRKKERIFEKRDVSKDVQTSSPESANYTLVFVDGSPYSFDLEDLLRASAEVLGKGSLGTSYKAVLEDGSAVVVKRLRDLTVSYEEFEQQIGTISKLRHRNLIPLRAYYYSKDEKLLVQDYFPLGSLSLLLHGPKGAGRTSLDWDARLKIALGVAQGIAYLHEQGGNMVIHGNIKSTNVLLNYDHEAFVSDYCIAPLFNTSGLASRIVSYKAPEMTETHKLTQKSDVYNFGVLLLELLTRKVPLQTAHEEGVDLPHWVQSVVREEWTSEVFDVELMHYQNIEEEMVQTLQIAMACVATAPDQRPQMSEVVKMLEDVRQDDMRKPTSKELSDYTPPLESNSLAVLSPKFTG